MNMKRIRTGLCTHMVCLCLLACMMLASSCRHRKDAASDDSSSSVAGLQDAGLASKMVQRINANRHTEEYLTAKAGVRLESGRNNVSVNGTLRMKRDEVIQLSLAFLGLMEVGRMEITPDYFLLIDRMNHQYVRVAYSQVPFFQQSGIDFHTFQSLFWGELFLPGDAGKAPQSQSYDQEIAGDTLSLTSEVRRQAALHFVASLSRALLLQTSVVARDSHADPLMSWDYSNYKSFCGKQFPTGMLMKLSAGTLKAQVTLSLSNLKNNSDWQTRTEVNTKKYKQVSIESIIRRLASLSM